MSHLKIGDIVIKKNELGYLDFQNEGEITWYCGTLKLYTVVFKNEVRYMREEDLKIIR